MDNQFIKWDGKTNGGVPVPDDTYYAVATFANCGSQITIQQTIQLCRGGAVCNLGDHMQVSNYVPPLFGLEPPPTN